MTLSPCVLGIIGALGGYDSSLHEGESCLVRQSLCPGVGGQGSQTSVNGVLDRGVLLHPASLQLHRSSGIDRGPQLIRTELGWVHERSDLVDQYGFVDQLGEAAVEDHRDGSSHAVSDERGLLAVPA